MTIAHDALSSPSGLQSSDFSWTHTPSGTPRGVLVLIIQGGNNGLDQVAGVTYGAVAMAEVPLSPLLVDATGEDGAVYGYFLGSGIPTGAQTVSVDTTAAGTRHAVCVTMTAAADCVVDDTTTLEAVVDDPSVTLTTTALTQIYGALYSGRAVVTAIGPAANYTSLLEVDFDQDTGSFLRRSATVAAGSPTCGWITDASDDAGVLAVAIREQAGDIVALEGKAASASSAKATTLDRTRGFDGKASTASWAKAELSILGQADFAGKASTAAHARGELSRERPLVGHADTASHAKASLARLRGIAGKAASASYARGNLTVTNPLQPVGSIMGAIDSVAIQTTYGLIGRGQPNVYAWWVDSYHLDWDIRYGAPGHEMAAAVDIIQPDHLVFGFQGNAVLANWNRSAVLGQGAGTADLADWKARVADSLIEIGNDLLARFDPENVVWLRDYSVSWIPSGNWDLINWAAALNWCSQVFQGPGGEFETMFPNFTYVSFGAAKSWTNPAYRMGDGIHLNEAGSYYMADRVIEALQTRLTTPPPPPPPPPPVLPPPSADPGIVGSPGPGSVGPGAYRPYAVPARYRREVSDGYDLVVRAELLLRGTNEIKHVLDVVDGGLQGGINDGIATSCRMTCVDPEDTITPANSDEELNTNTREVRILMGPRYANGEEDLIQIGVYKPKVLSRSSADGALLFRMECYERSHAALRPFGTAFFRPAGTPVEVAIRDMIWSAVPTMPMALPITGFTTPNIDLAGNAVPWTEAKKLALFSGYTLRVDRDGALTMYPAVLQAQSVPEWTFSEGPLSTFWNLEVVTETDRQPNYVIVRSAPVGQPGIEAIAYDDDPTSETYVHGPYDRVKSEPIINAAITSLEQAQAAAAAILLRGIGPRKAPSFSCLPNGAVGLDATVRLEHSIGLNDNVLVNEINNLPFTAEGEMDLGTRRSILTGSDASVSV